MKAWQLYKDKVYTLTIVFTLVFQSFRHAYGTISFLLLLAVGIVGYFNKPLKFKTYYLWPILFYLVMSLSIIWSLEPSLTYKGIMRLAPLACIPLVICLGYDISKKQFESIFNKFSLIYAFVAFFFITNGLINYYTSGHTKFLFYHTLVEPSKLNAIYASSFAFVAYVWILLKQYKVFIYQLSAIVLLSFIILLSSKLLITLSIVLSLFLLIKHLKINFKIIAIVFLMLISSIFLIKPDNFISKRFSTEQTTNFKEIFNCQNFTKVYPWTGTGLRLFQIRLGLEIIEDKPQTILYGLGFNASQPSVVKKHKKYNLYPGYYEYNFHNQYLQTIVELGILGLLLLMVCLYQILNLYIKKHQRFPLLIFVLFLVLFITESYLMRQRGIIFFSLLYALLPKNNKITD